MTDRIAVVTGGASGIGAAVSGRLASEGFRVVLADIDHAKAADVAARLPGGTAMAVDLGEPREVDLLADRIIAEVGRVDVLVNNAGVATVQPFADTDPAEWDKSYRVNLRAPMQLTHRLMPGMIERGWGRLIYIATDGARAGASGEAVYATFKAGMFGLAKTVAREAGRSGVTSNVVCPGLIETPMLQRVRDEHPGMVAALTKGIPLKRAGDPSEVAGLVAYLASDDSSYVTGQVLSVSGGVTMA